MTTLPTKTSLTDAATTEGAFRTALDNLIDYLTENFTTSGAGVIKIENQNAVGSIPLTVKGMAAQTGDLIQLVDSADSLLLSVDSVGNLDAVGLSVGGNAVLTTASTGLNADTLDGLDSTEFAVLADSETITGTWTHKSIAAGAFIAQAGDTAPTSGDQIMQRWNQKGGIVAGRLVYDDALGGTLLFQVYDDAGANPIELSLSQDGTILWNGVKVLTENDEGSGGGIDADLLDGLHAAAFAQLASANIYTAQQTINYSNPTLVLDTTLLSGAWHINMNSSGQLRFVQTGGSIAYEIEFRDKDIQLAKMNASGMTVLGSNVATEARANIFTGTQTISSTQPILDLAETDTSRTWRLTVAGNDLILTQVAGTAAAISLRPNGAETVRITNSQTVFTTEIVIQNASPNIKIQETGVTADNGNWLLQANAESLTLFAQNDAGSGSGQNLKFERTGFTLDSMAFQKAGTPWFLVDATNSKVGIGVGATPNEMLDVAGNIRASSSLFFGGLGAVGAPTFSFHADPDTGIYRAANNSLSVTTGGVRRFQIGDAGEIGLGTSADEGTSGQVLTSAGPGAQAAWQDSVGGLPLIDSWTFSSAVANVDFINLTYNNLIIVITGISGGSSTPRFRFSSNNGSSFDATSYWDEAGVTTSTEVSLMTHVGSANTQDGIIWISGFNEANAKPIGMYTGRLSNNTFVRKSFGRDVAAAYNAIRFSWASGNFDEGRIFVYGG